MVSSPSCSLGFHTAQCTEWQAECASHTQGSLKDKSPLGEGPQVGCLRKPQVRGVDSATTPCFQKSLLHRSSIRRPLDETEVPSNTGELGIRRRLADVLGKSKWHHHSLRPWNIIVQLVGAAIDLAKLLLGQRYGRFPASLKSLFQGLLLAHCTNPTGDH